jgi:hypothetical protein
MRFQSDNVSGRRVGASRIAARWARGNALPASAPPEPHGKLQKTQVANPIANSAKQQQLPPYHSTHQTPHCSHVLIAEAQSMSQVRTALRSPTHGSWH